MRMLVLFNLQDQFLLNRGGAYGNRCGLLLIHVMQEFVQPSNCRIRKDRSELQIARSLSKVAHARAKRAHTDHSDPNRTFDCLSLDHHALSLFLLIAPISRASQSLFCDPSTWTLPCFHKMFWTVKCYRASLHTAQTWDLGRSMVRLHASYPPTPNFIQHRVAEACHCN
jgi:hypothetical protein